MIRLSVIVIFFNMRREASRTLYSLCPQYQQDIDPEDYEVIAIDNGSTEPLDPGSVDAFGANFHYIRHETKSPSPVEAVNLGARVAKADNLLLCVDGARISTPGTLALTLSAIDAFAPRPTLIATLAWHLGPDVQDKSMNDGYGRDVEDQLLADIDWRNNGYDLFSISTLAPSSRDGWLLTPAESSLISLPRAHFQSLGGFDERFQSPGGGLATLDFFKRALALEELAYVMLLGEGTFHQFHGGVSTNVLPSPFARFSDEYLAIRGESYSRPSREPVYFGSVPEQCLPFLQLSVERARNRESER